MIMIDELCYATMTDSSNKIKSIALGNKLNYDDSSTLCIGNEESGLSNEVRHTVKEGLIQLSYANVITS